MSSQRRRRKNDLSVSEAVVFHMTSEEHFAAPLSQTFSFPLSHRCLAHVHAPSIEGFQPGLDSGATESVREGVERGCGAYLMSKQDIPAPLFCVLPVLDTEKQLRGLNNGGRSQLFFPLSLWLYSTRVAGSGSGGHPGLSLRPVGDTLQPCFWTVGGNSSP